MRRMIIVLTVLAFAMPSMAGVTITLTDEGIEGTPPNQLGVVRIDYTTDANVSAFALDVEFDSGATVNDVCDYHIGDSNGTTKGFGIFLDKVNGIQINPQGQIVAYGRPVAHKNSSPDAHNTGKKKKKIILEMGALYEEGNQPTWGPIMLCRIKYDSCNDCNVTVTGNATRGRIVLENATEALTNLPQTLLGLRDSNDPCCPPPVVPVPNIVGMTEAAAGTALGLVGLVANAATLTYDGAPVGNVVRQDPVAATVVLVGSSVDMEKSQGVCASMYAGHMTPDYTAMPIDGTGPAYSDYTDYVAVRYPDCWCTEVNPRQCWGDADAAAEGGSKLLYWVYSQDLNTLLAAWGKSYPDMQDASGVDYEYLTTTVGLVPWICADYDHYAEGGSKLMYRVYSRDLNIMLDKTFHWGVYNKPDPTCP